jgi:carotenoid cleavage dioxygenase-like enzyme
MEWGGKVWALWEGDRARILDPLTLETREEEDLQGAVPPGRPFTGKRILDC